MAPEAPAAGGTDSRADSLELIRDRARDFVSRRDWQRFQSPKNLSMALIAEAAELVEHFQWLDQAESRRPGADRLTAISEELADVLIYLVRIADELGVDLAASAAAKLDKNAAKYPVGGSPIRTDRA